MKKAAQDDSNALSVKLEDWIWESSLGRKNSKNNNNNSNNNKTQLTCSLINDLLLCFLFAGGFSFLPFSKSPFCSLSRAHQGHLFSSEKLKKLADDDCGDDWVSVHHRICIRGTLTYGLREISPLWYVRTYGFVSTMRGKALIHRFVVGWKCSKHF